MNMIEKNYRAWCVQKNIELEEDVPMDDLEAAEQAEDEELDELSGGPDNYTWEPKTPRGKVGGLVREKVKKVLEECGLAQQRAQKCDEADFLKYVVLRFSGLCCGH